MDLKAKRAFDKAYALLDDYTPRKFDCGKICSSACCKSISFCEDKNTMSGMCLLPFEKEYLQELGAVFEYGKSSDGCDILICDGKCERSIRPFACRIFPYLFRMTENGHIKIIPDIRGFSVCPIIRSSAFGRKSVHFVRSMKKAIRELSKIPEISDDLQRLVQLNDSLYEFYNKLI